MGSSRNTRLGDTVIKMFNATVAGASNHYLRSEHISDSRGSSRKGSGHNIGEVELGASRHNKTVLEAKVLLIRSDRSMEKSILFRHKTAIVTLIVVVTLKLLSLLLCM